MDEDLNQELEQYIYIVLRQLNSDTHSDISLDLAFDNKDDAEDYVARKNNTDRVHFYFCDSVVLQKKGVEV